MLLPVVGPVLGLTLACNSLLGIDGIKAERADTDAAPNWTSGEDVIIAPSVSDEQAKERFGDFKAPKPYLRYTKQPS